jgi:hypothetical protein
MPFDPHAFISYAHIDNEPLRPGKPRWVNEFHGALQVKVAQRLGRPVSIWRDDKLRGDDVFGPEILDRLATTALLVSVVTPRYVHSDWCKKEVLAFEAAAQKTGGVEIDNRSRVLKVLKTPLPPGEVVPAVLERTLGVPFYVQDGPVDREIDPVLGADAEAEFHRRVIDLAVLMADRLRALGITPGPDAAQVPPSGQTVYVAECGRDLQPARAALVTELRLHGHAVLPEAPLPLVEDALRAAVQADLARATLAVHLVGASAGPVPEGPGGQSLVALQAALGAQRSAAAGLPRLLWLPPGIQGERPEHQALIDQLLGDAALQQGADLLRGDAEALKAAVHQTLQRLRAAPPSAAPGDGTPRVHLVMTPQDGPTGRALAQALRALGLQVSVPAFSGDAAELRRVNGERLAAADAVLLLHGAGDAAWAQAQDSDLLKQAALATRAPRRWTVVAAPRTEAKDEALAFEPDATLDLLGGDAAAVAARVAATLAPAASPTAASAPPPPAAPPAATPSTPAPAAPSGAAP